MSAFRQIENTLERTIHELEAKLPQIASEVAALDAVQAAASRILRTGKDADGNPLKFGQGTPYSEKEAPVFFYRGRTLNAKGVALLDEAEEEGEGVSYKEFRKAQGLQTAHVDLTYTGQMWRDISVLSVLNKGGMVRVTIGAKTNESNDKVEWNNARYKTNILRLNKQELEEVNQDFSLRVEALISKNFQR